MGREVDMLHDSKRRSEQTFDIPDTIWLTTPVTSTAWDGDGYSTTAKTLIDLSAVFSGVPANIKAVYIGVEINDSGSAATPCYLLLSPNSTAGEGLSIAANPVNDRKGRGAMWVPCNVDGDIYYQIVASGPGTFDVYLFVWGWIV